MAARPITELEPREDTGSHKRPALLPPPAPPPQPSRVRRAGRDRAALLVWGLAAAWAGLFSWLSVQRYRGFSTGRFDLGNMVQAVWSTANGSFLDTTDVSGVQFNRLGAHVDPVLALFAPLWMVWSSPEMLLVAQAVIVAAGGPARVLAGAALARRRPPGRGGRGRLPDGAGPDARHAVRLPPGHARGAAPDVLHLGGGGGALGHARRLRDPGGALPGAGGPADRRARGLAVVPPPGSAAGGRDPRRRGARVGGDRVRGDPAVVRARRASTRT